MTNNTISDTNKYKNWKLMTVNINGLSSNSQDALHYYLTNNNALISWITEIKRLESEKYDIPGYTTLARNSSTNPRKSGGVALILHNRTSPSAVNQLQSGDTDILWAYTIIDNRTAMIGGLYIRPNDRIGFAKALENIETALIYAAKQGIQDIVIMGDFNARHFAWGDKMCNANGEDLLAFQQKHCLFNLNEGEPTFFCTGGGQSVIDHILCSKSMINRSTGYLKDTKVELYTGAPNRGDVPLWNSFSFGPSKEGNPSPDWSKANWDVWRHTLDTHVASQWPELVSTDEPCELWNRLLQLLQDSRIDCVPNRRPSAHMKPYFTNEQRDLSEKLRAANRNMKFRSDPNRTFQYKELRDEFKSLLQTSRQNFYFNCPTAMNNSSGSTFWRSKNKIFGKETVKRTVKFFIPKLRSSITCFKTSSQVAVYRTNSLTRTGRN